jgi:hypothetical protein
LNNSGQSGHTFFILDFRGNGFSFSSFYMMLAAGLSYIAFMILRNVPSILSFFRAFIKNERTLNFIEGFFLHLLRRWSGLLPWFCLGVVLHLLIQYTILASLKWNLDYSVWSF